MPIHLTHGSRREFLGTLAAAGVSGLIYRSLDAAEAVGDDFLALLSDTHVPKDRSIQSRNVNMTENLEQVVAELLALDAKPAGVIINGDCAHLKGLADDYKSFASVIGPLVEAKLPVHLTMGNHDQRQHLYEELKNQQHSKPVVAGKHVSLLEMPRANWFLLDSLFETDVVTGELGADQLQWLAAALGTRREKPAILMVHHNPQWVPLEQVPGLRDTQQLFKLMTAHQQVKALVFGHTHNWQITAYEGIHLVNLPPTAYVFNPEMPNGWVSAQVRDDGMTLQISTLDKRHKTNGQKVDLAWR